MTEPKAIDLIIITSSYFVAGIDWNSYYTFDGSKRYNHRCAPIIGYMRTWDKLRILEYCAKKHWKCEMKWK
jgi:hypothetical protein